MRTLFNMDKKDYDDCTHSFVRNSARAIIIRDHKVAMVRSLKYGYYKFPGGGIHGGEDPVEAMIREAREEAGLNVIRDSIKEYGMVHRIQKSDKDKTEVFIQDNFYYLCDAEEETVAQELDAYEADEEFTPVTVDPETAINANLNVGETPWDKSMFVREAKVLQLLIEEGAFS